MGILFIMGKYEIYIKYKWYDYNSSESYTSFLRWDSSNIDTIME